MLDQEESNSLVTVVQYFRHGQRASMSDYPNNPYGEDAYWPSEMGSLTNTGMQEMYDLGKFTRQRYKHFLPNWCPIKNFQIYTTDQPRTVQSAQAFTVGLYPPPKAAIWNEKIPWVPIPTYYEEHLFTSGLKTVAPAYSKEVETLLEEYMEEFKKDPMAEYISVHSGVELKSYLKFGFLYDTLSVQDSMGLKLPEWTKKVYPNISFYENCIKAMIKTVLAKRILVGPQLDKIIQHFGNMIKDPNSGPKLITFSGHDVNICGVLDTMGAFEFHLPPIASSLFIELRKKNGNHYVNVFYKRENVVPVKLGGTKFDYTFEEFKKLVDKYVITDEEFVKEGSLKES